MARKRKKTVESPNPEAAHVRFSVAHLRERLALFKGLMPRRAIRKDCSAYHFDIRPDGPAFVSATDLENRMRVNLEVMHRLGHGRLMLDARALDTMLGAYVAPTVEFSLDTKEDVLATGHLVKLTLPGHDPAKECHVEVEGPLSDSVWSVQGDALADALEKTRFAMDPSSSRYALGNILLEFPEEGSDLLTLVSTDGRRLCRTRVPVKRHGDSPIRFWRPPSETKDGLPLLDHKVVPVVLRLARAAGPRHTAFAVIPGRPTDLEKDVWEDGLVQFLTREAVLTSKIADMRFPRYQDVFPNDEVKARVGFSSAGILGDFIEAAVAATDSESRAMEWVMAGGTVMLSTEAVTRGKAEMYVPATGHEGRGTVTVDPTFLRDFLKAAGELPLEVRYFSSKHPLWFSAGADYEMLVMPMGGDDRRPAGAPPVETEQSQPEPCVMCGESAVRQDPALCVKCAEGTKPEANEDDQPEDDSDGNVPDEPTEPEPIAPVGATTDAHEGNGKARKPGRNGRKK